MRRSTGHGRRRALHPAVPGTVAARAAPRCPRRSGSRRREHGGRRARAATSPSRAVSGGDSYRVRASIEPQRANCILIVAAPLNDVNSTLHRLLLIELLVTAFVLAAIALLGLWVVRLGLRPLDAIGETAARSPPATSRRRVERAEDADRGRPARARAERDARADRGARSAPARRRRQAPPLRRRRLARAADAARRRARLRRALHAAAPRSGPTTSSGRWPASAASRSG